MERFETPVLFLIFNRPDLTEIVFKRIREVKPKFLFVAADGPRPNHPEDVEKCQKARETVLNLIDWDCELKTLFRDKNLGCGKAVSEAITWFFEHVEEGIILEDDILPEVSFFKYAEEMLVRYEENKKIMGITGLNWQNGKKRGKGSYYFSSYPGIWGWATWSDRWKKFKLQPNIRENNMKLLNVLNRISGYNKIKRFHLDHFTCIGKIDTWDYSWKYCVFINQGAIVTPQVNLNSNIGFDINSTHTNSKNSKLANRKTYSLEFPLIHPEKLEVNRQADEYFGKKYLIAKEFYLKNFILKSLSRTWLLKKGTKFRIFL